MGEVFAAVDTRLERTVALKFLPDDFAADSQRLQRFEAEAKTLAALNHPNILSIFESGLAGGRPFLVSELLEGESLRDRLERGALPHRKALEYALQIAEGLAAAHGRGVVHRDLKPENIFITSSGRVKILDFGVAKLRALPGSSKRGTETGAPTLLESRAHTEPGMLVGTPAYMSPEQVRGDSVDHRSDLFSFGCVLYEMFFGQRAFRKETAVQTMNAILTEDPPEVITGELAPGIERLVRRCLEKSPQHRFQSASDLAFAIDALSGSRLTSSVSSRPNAPGQTNARRVAFAALLTLGVAVLAAGAFIFGKRASGPALERSPILTPERLGGPSAFYPRVSPDGKELAFATLVNGICQLGVMIIETGDWRVLTTNRDSGQTVNLAWSPNGSEILYDRVIDVPQGVFRVSKYGGEEKFVTEGCGPLPLPDGSVIVGLVKSNAMTVELHWYRPGRPLEALGAFAVTQARLMPNGEELVYVGWPADQTTNRVPHIHLLDLNTKRSRQLVEKVSSEFAWQPVALNVNRTGSAILYTEVSGNSTHLLALDLKRNRSRTVASVPWQTLAIDSSADGTLYVDEYNRPAEVVRARNKGSEIAVERIALPPTALTMGQVLPLSGNRLLVTCQVLGQRRVMVVNARGETALFLQTAEESSAPYALLGQDRVLCAVGSGSNSIMSVVTLEGRLLERIEALPRPKEIKSVASSPDGSRIYYQSSDGVWELKRSGGEPKRIRDGDWMAIEPDGKAIIVLVTKGDGVLLYRVPLDGRPEQQIRVSPRYRLASGPLAPNAIAPDGRIAVSIAPTNSFFWPAGALDPETGEVELLVDLQTDTGWAGWDDDGRFVASSLLMRPGLWRLRGEQSSNE